MQNKMQLESRKLQSKCSQNGHTNTNELQIPIQITWMKYSSLKYSVVYISTVPSFLHSLWLYLYTSLYFSLEQYSSHVWIWHRIVCIPKSLCSVNFRLLIRVSSRWESSRCTTSHLGPSTLSQDSLHPLFPFSMHVENFTVSFELDVSKPHIFLVSVEESASVDVSDVFFLDIIISRLIPENTANAWSTGSSNASKLKVSHRISIKFPQRTYVGGIWSWMSGSSTWVIITNGFRFWQSKYIRSTA